MEINSFITKDMFTNLASCIAIVEAFTESFKLLFGDITNPYILWIAFIFSSLVSFIRLLLTEELTKENIILMLVNVIIIFLGSIGIYQVGIKPIEKLILN